MSTLFSIGLLFRAILENLPITYEFWSVSDIFDAVSSLFGANGAFADLPVTGRGDFCLASYLASLSVFHYPLELARSSPGPFS